MDEVRCVLGTSRLGRVAEREVVKVVDEGSEDFRVVVGEVEGFGVRGCFL